MMWNDGMGWSGWLVMSLTALAFWVLVVVVVVSLFRGPRTGTETRVAGHDGHTGRAGHPSEGSADLILDERFARGEIDADEYLARRIALRSAR